MKWASFGFLALAVFLLGCPTTTTSGSPYTPVTGIEVDAQSLLAGVGCGTGADQVFMYAGVVSYTSQADANIPPNIDVTSGVYDCFTNGLFSNLAASEAGTEQFTIRIFAFNAASFPPELSCADDAGASVMGGTQGVSCPGNKPGTVEQYAPFANWTTTCTAMQVAGVTVPAACSPLKRAEPTGDAGLDDSAVAD